MRRLSLLLGSLLSLSHPTLAGDAVLVGVEPAGPNSSTITLSTVIQAKPEAVWRWLTAYDHHAGFMPYMTKSRVVERGADSLLVEQEGRIRILFWTFTMRVVQRVSETPPVLMRFSAVDGDFTRLEGEFALTPEANVTALSCRFTVQPRRQVPVWAVRMAAKHYLKTMVARLKEKSEEAPHGG